VKFPQVPIGERFEYKGDTLVKIGPMTACSAGGGESRLIPRSAVVVPTGTPVAAPKALTPALVEEALAACEGRWRAAVGGLDESCRVGIEAALVAAQQELSERLGLGLSIGPKR
jgi:hypothetical protein